MSTENKTPEATQQGGETKKVMPRLLGKPYFQRKKSCPFSGPRALKIDYKDTRTLSRFISDQGKIMPSHITGVSHTHQRKLSMAIRRARHLALLPYSEHRH